MLYQDEISLYQQPSQGWLWSYMGRQQPKLGGKSPENRCLRVLGYLNAVTGQVHHECCASVTADYLARSVAQISAWYPQAQRVWLAWDNWPVHHHPKVQAALRAQPRVQVLPLPTYAPWLNPIEKVWLWLRQHFTHAHPFYDNFSLFTENASAFLASLKHHAQELIRYTGLLI